MWFYLPVLVVFEVQGVSGGPVPAAAEAASRVPPERLDLQKQTSTNYTPTRVEFPLSCITHHQIKDIDTPCLLLFTPLLKSTSGLVQTKPSHPDNQRDCLFCTAIVAACTGLSCRAKMHSRSRELGIEFRE